jgi:Flp pilus assembly protein TadG
MRDNTLPRSEALMRRRTNQRGQAMLESALVMLIFLPVLFGIMDFGQFFYLHQSLTERIRAAARYGAVHTFTDGSDIVNVAIYNDPTGTANGATAILPNLSSGATCNGCVSAALTGAGTEDARIQVKINKYPYSFLIIPSSLNPPTITITDTEPYEIGR